VLAVVELHAAAEGRKRKVLHQLRKHELA